jgi:hypothetical protein
MAEAGDLGLDQTFEEVQTGIVRSESESGL